MYVAKTRQNLQAEGGRQQSECFPLYLLVLPAFDVMQMIGFEFIDGDSAGLIQVS